MKKFFVALMAVLVLVSCGDGKKSQAAMTEADVMMATVDIMNTAAERIEKATTTDELIDAMAAMAKEVKEVEARAGETIEAVENMDQNVLLEKYPEQAEAVQAAGIRYTEAVMGKMGLMETLTPEQEARMMKIFEDLEL